MSTVNLSTRLICSVKSTSGRRNSLPDFSRLFRFNPQAQEMSLKRIDYPPRIP
jgi:hypothetical protein